MSNRALRAAMWSLLCAVGLIAVVAIGDPQSLQQALAKRSQISRPGRLIAESSVETTRSPGEISVSPDIELPAPEPSITGQPPLRVAATDDAQLHLDRDQLLSSTAGAKRTTHAELLRPHPEFDLDQLNASQLNVDRRVPEPLLDPFEETVGDTEVASSVAVPSPAFDESRVSEIAEAAIERRLVEIRDQVIAAHQARIAREAAFSRQESAFQLPGSKPPSPVSVAGKVPTIAVSDPVRGGRPFDEAGHKAEQIGSGRFRLDIAGATVPEALRIIGDAAGQNIVVAPEVVGDVNFNLNDVSVDEALEALASVHDLIVEPGSAFVLVRKKTEADTPSARQHGHLPIITPGPRRVIDQSPAAADWSGPVAAEPAPAAR